MQVFTSSDEHCPPDAAAWCLSEAKKGTNALGFVPKPRFLADFARGRVFLVTCNDDLVAYLLRGAFRPTTVITQLWVRSDARRVLHATAVVEALATRARAAGVARIRLRCADDLAANSLWPTCGFVHAKTKAGGEARGRLIKVWERDVSPLLFGVVDVLSENGKCCDDLSACSCAEIH